MRWVPMVQVLRHGLLAAAVALAVLLGLAGPARAELVGSVSGVVTANGRPVANTWVTLLPVTATGGWAGRGITVPTDSSGRYAIADVYAPLVKVLARAPLTGGLVSTYWPRSFTFADAGVLRVASSGSVADLDLPPGGAAQGTVVDAATGRPLPGARVSAHAPAGVGWEEVGTARLGARPGTFELEGLPPTQVALQVRAPAGSDYLGQWYDGAGYAQRARLVDGGGQTSGLVVALRRGGRIEGVVRDDTGAPVAGADVSLVACPDSCPMVVRTDQSGAYQVRAIPPGPGLMLHVAAGEALLPEWFAPTGADGRFPLRAGQALRGVDVTLTRGAFLEGVVRDAATGEALTGASAELVAVDDSLRSYVSTRLGAGRAGGAPGPSPEATSSGPTPAGIRLGLPAPGRGVLGLTASSASTGGSPPPGGSPPAGGSPPPGGSNPPAPASPPSASPASPAGPGTGRWVVGPAAPGEYALVVHPGDPALLPATWVSARGLDSARRVRLAPGQRAQVVVELRVSRPTSPSPVPVSTPAHGAPSSGSGGSQCRGAATAAPVGAWPGLPAGFLAAPPGW